MKGRWGHATEWFQLKPSIARGYLQVSLYRNGLANYRKVHTLVLEAFVGPRPPGMEACHYPDRDTRNCRADNLKWGTSEENHDHQIEHGTRVRGEDAHNAKLTTIQVATIRREYSRGKNTLKIFADRFGVSIQTVRRALAGKTWADASNEKPLIPRQRSSRFRGVTFHKQRKRWAAQIVRDGRPKHIGLFDSEEDAARAYDEHAVALNGEAAILNFPQ